MKDLETAPAIEVLEAMAENEAKKDSNVDRGRMNRQIYSVLSLSTSEASLQKLKGMKEQHGVRGALHDA